MFATLYEIVIIVLKINNKMPKAKHNLVPSILMD